MPDTERFLRKAVAGLPYRKRSEAQDELRTHIKDGIEHRVAQGNARSVAEQEAVEAIGDAAALNRGLLRAHFGRKWLLHYLYSKLSWRLPELGHIQLRPKFMIWKHSSKYPHQYAEGRYDEIIPRLERELTVRGPNDDIHHELGLAYNASGDYGQALTHLQAAVDWRKAHAKPKTSPDDRDLKLSVAYSSLAGVLERLGRHDEAMSAVRAGLVANGRCTMLNLQRARFLAEHGNSSEAMDHLEVSLSDPTPVVGKFDRGQTVLLILSTDKYDPVRKDPRFSGLVQRAYGDLAGKLEPMAGDVEVEKALQDSLGENGERFLTNYQQAKCSMERGDLDGTFQHLEATLSDKGSSVDLGKTLLFLLTSHVFDSLRGDPRFDHLLLHASHWP
jgi:tetratricopeptide (TPR) repeat protein